MHERFWCISRLPLYETTTKYFFSSCILVRGPAALTPLTLSISLRGFGGFTSDACSSVHAGTIVAEGSLDKNGERRRRLVSWVKLFRLKVARAFRGRRFPD